MSDEDELWCPRRAEAPTRFPGPDTWRDRPSMANASALTTPTCSYCGSLEPGRFLDLIEAAWIVGPTDKNYKAYLYRPLTPDEMAERKQQWLSGRVGQAIRRVEEASGKSPAEVAAQLDKRWECERSTWGGTQCEAKIYFQHLSVEQKRQFIALYNDKRMTIGAPGYFYTAPYFCAFDNPDG